MTSIFLSQEFNIEAEEIRSKFVLLSSIADLKQLTEEEDIFRHMAMSECHRNAFMNTWLLRLDEMTDYAGYGTKFDEYYRSDDNEYIEHLYDVIGRGNLSIDIGFSHGKKGLIEHDRWISDVYKMEVFVHDERKIYAYESLYYDHLGHMEKNTPEIDDVNYENKCEKLTYKQDDVYDEKKREKLTYKQDELENPRLYVSTVSVKYHSKYNSFTEREEHIIRKTNDILVPEL